MQCRGLYTEFKKDGNADTIFVYCPNGYITNELETPWLEHSDTWTRDQAPGTMAETSASRPSMLSPSFA